MSDDEGPDYEQLRGMGFICWREINDYNTNDNDTPIAVKENVPTKTDDIPAKKLKTKKKKKASATRSNQTHATSTLHSANKPASNNADDDKSQMEHDTARKIWLDLGVSKTIVQALIEQKFYEPTQIQRMVLPSAIRDRLDIIGAAETGSGKTLAFGIPILTHMENLIKQGEVKYGQFLTLILTPTRELAVQITSHLQTACQYTKLNIAVVVGGMSTHKQERLLSKHPEIVVATPGRFWELINEGDKHISNLSQLRFLVIDETDRMIEKGHFVDLEKILNLCNNLIHLTYSSEEMNHPQRQKFVFSATLMMKELEAMSKNKKQAVTDEHEKLAVLISVVGMSTKPKIIDLTKKFGTVETLTEARVTCSLEEKDHYLYYFLSLYPGRTLIFTNSIDCIKRLQSILTILKMNSLPLHAQMEQKQRLTNLEKFSSSENGILIATDVAARGLDIPNIQHVIHYQVPRSTQLYIHRSGRTARAEREGLSVIVICPEELHLYRKIIKTLNRDEDLQTFPVDFTNFSNIKKRVKLAVEISKLHHQVAKTTHETNWYFKAAKELDIELDEDIRDNELAKSAGTSDSKIKEQQLRNELNILLKQKIKSSDKIYSNSYPLLFGDPEKLLTKKVNLTAIDELKQRKPKQKKRKA
ncbi:unnamed protein product [Didymodactylos carnosus]|uniref:ATP-dependent RNA helicase n=1 Tax=Didymodactylos carnosus TaxID=1234261 RepID=A0A8S2DPA0_9BILA|nr:unnamed protein product [Didymodactylos carnosus]CAF3747725.1 unnamed protein product [Didymodactylos carnosus]